MATAFATETAAGSVCRLTRFDNRRKLFFAGRAGMLSTQSNKLIWGVSFFLSCHKILNAAGGTRTRKGGNSRRILSAIRRPIPALQLCASTRGSSTIAAVTALTAVSPSLIVGQRFRPVLEGVVVLVVTWVLDLVRLFHCSSPLVLSGV
jgi:hypothetical protein